MSLARSLAILVLSFLVAACQTSRHFYELNLKLHKETLSNGLQVVVVEDDSLPLVSFQTWYHVGSAKERFGITGISHLFEHLMFSGTKNFGNRVFFETLEKNGANVNAFTTRDFTVFLEEFDPKLLEKVIELESDRMAYLEVSESKLNIQKRIALEERRIRLEDSPDQKIQEILWQLAYRRHPYKWPVTGLPEDLVTIELKHVQEYLYHYFQPGNAVLVIAGDVKVGETLELVKKHYSEIPGRKPAQPEIPIEPEQKEERRYTLREKEGAERFAHAYHITSIRDADTPALDVLANILFQGKQSRVYRELVEKKELLVSVDGSAYTPEYPGLFLIHGVSRKEAKLEEVERALWQILQRIQKEGVSEEEVERAVKQLSIQTLSNVRSPKSLAQILGTVKMVFDDPSRFVKDLDAYHQVSPLQVRQVAQRYFQPNNRSVVLYVNSEKR